MMFPYSQIPAMEQLFTDLCVVSVQMQISIQTEIHFKVTVFNSRMLLYSFSCIHLDQTSGLSRIVQIHTLISPVATTNPQNVIPAWVDVWKLSCWVSQHHETERRLAGSGSLDGRSPFVFHVFLKQQSACMIFSVAEVRSFNIWLDIIAVIPSWWVEFICYCGGSNFSNVW